MAWWNIYPWYRPGAGQKPYRTSRKGLLFSEPLPRPFTEARKYRSGKKTSLRIIW